MSELMFDENGKKVLSISSVPEYKINTTRLVAN